MSDLRESWFGKPVRSSSAPPPPPAPERPHGATFVLGACAGAIGGVVALLAAGAMTKRDLAAHMAIAETIGRGAGSDFVVGLVIGALAGAALGGVLALVMRHGSRFIGRVSFGVVASAALWFCFHVLLVARHRGTLPLVPMLVGTCVYGVVIACVPPARKY